MTYAELFEILDDLDPCLLSAPIIIESEMIGESEDVEFDAKSLRFLAYE